MSEMDERELTGLDDFSPAQQAAIAEIWRQAFEAGRDDGFRAGYEAANARAFGELAESLPPGPHTPAHPRPGGRQPDQYKTRSKTAAQIRAAAEYSWRRVEQQIQAREHRAA